MPNYRLNGVKNEEWVEEEGLMSALFWHIMQRIVLIPYGRFGTTYRSHRDP
jgi:hypothetical protein